MIPSQHPELHLTYCMNVHSGDSFYDQWRAAEIFAVDVRDQLAVGQPFGLGLRLGAPAAEELKSGDLLQAFSAWCRRENMYVFTVNAFPFGRFHGAPVKAGVYRPDWTTPERLQYTIAAADALAGILPDGMAGSISTVPCWYALDYPENVRESAIAKAVDHLIKIAEHMDRLASATGKNLTLGLEPEPWCFLETSHDVIAFFTEKLFKSHGGKYEDSLRRRIGVCIDTCHCALAYEQPADVISNVISHGIRIAKIQISSAPLIRQSGDAAHQLTRFNEPIYFHQVAANMPNGTIRKWPDLDPAIIDLANKSEWDEARIHFHVPLHWAGTDAVMSTRDVMDEEFWRIIKAGCCPHLEIETYTFGVLPDEIVTDTLAQSIQKEYRWVLNKLGKGQKSRLRKAGG